MPRAEGLYLREWINRLWGPATTGLEPDVVPSVQPVISIGDMSGLVPPLLGPMAFAGGRRTVQALTVGMWELQCSSPGGLFVTHLIWMPESGANLAGKITLRTPFSPAGTFAFATSTKFDMVPEQPTRSAFFFGDGNSSGAGPDHPHLNAAPNDFHGIIPSGVLFVPPGSGLHGELDDLGGVHFLFIAWREIAQQL